MVDVLMKAADLDRFFRKVFFRSKSGRFSTKGKKTECSAAQNGAVVLQQKWSPV